MHASLGVPVLTACLAMLGKQWLSRYDQIKMRGTLIQRSQHRHGKRTRMTTWRLDITVEVSPSCSRSPPAFLLWALEVLTDCQSNGCGSHHRHFVAQILLLRLHHLLLWMLVHYDVHQDGWYGRRSRTFKSFRGWVWDRPLVRRVTPQAQRFDFNL